MRSRSSKFTAVWVAIAILLAAAQAEAQPRRPPHAAQDEVSPRRPDRSRPALAPQTLFVDPASGSDRQAGSQRQPFQTITHALSMAQPNTVIWLSPGDYSLATGETFPLQLRPGVTVQGDPGSGQPATIRGGGELDSPARSQQNAAILAADQSGLVHVTVTNAQGHGIWVEAGSPTILDSALVGSQYTGIYIVSGSPTIQDSYFSQNGTAGLVIFGDSQARVQGNTFEATGTGITVAAGATPEIMNNQIVGNETGLILLGNAQPVLSNNQITGNQQNGTLTEPSNELASEPAAAKTTILTDRQPLQPTLPDALPIIEVTAPASPEWSNQWSESTNIQVADRPLPRILENRDPDLAEPAPLDSPVRQRESSDQPLTPGPAAVADRLRVPPSQIPMGSGSSNSFSHPSSGPSGGGPPPPPTRAATLGLHYKVFVEAPGEAAQAQIRELVPDAFRARFQGDDVMQVGAYPNEEEAIVRSQLLIDNGFEVQVEYFP